MAYDLGDTATPSIEIRDAAGTLAAGGAVTATITLPDGVTTASPAITNPSVGLYRATYLTTTPGRHVIAWTVTGANSGSHVDVFEVYNTDRAPLVSLPEVKRYLRLFTPDPSRDDELRQVLEAATTLCEDHADRCYRRRTVTETRDGGRCAIALRRGPVQTITTVTVNGTTLTGGDYTLDADAGLLYRGSNLSGQSWEEGRQNITITYVAGATVVSARVVEAVLVATAHLWEPRRGGSARAADTEYAGGAPYALPRRAEQLLERDLSATFA